MSYTFVPPSYRVVDTRRRPHVGWQMGITVVRVNGVFTTLQTPTQEVLDAAGVEGEDWFRGGHTYESVSDEVGAELAALGYDATAN